MKNDTIQYVMEHSVTEKRFIVSEDNVEKLQNVGYHIVEKKDTPPFDPDPPKASSKNSDGTPTSPMSRAKQLAKLAARLRNKKKEEGYVSHAQRKAVWASRNDKKNESVEENNSAPRTAAHRRAQLMTKRMQDNEKARQALKDPSHNPAWANSTSRVKESADLEEKYSWNDVNSALTKANYMRGNPAEISKVAKHFDHKSGNDKKFSHTDVKKNLSKAGIDAARHHNVMKHMKESVELDEAHAYAKAANALRDYANKSGGIDKKDFHTAAKHLDNVGKAGLMQKGQHLAKMNDHFRSLDTDVRDRIHMTLKKHGVMEAVQVDELKKSTLGSYIKKASQDASSKAYRSAMDAPSTNQAQRKSSGDSFAKSLKRQKGIEKATDKLTKEAKLDELSPATHKRYQDAAFKSGAKGMAQKRMGTMSAKDAYDNEKKRHKGIDTSKFLNRKQHGVKPESVEEAKDGDGVNIVKDRPFKGKPMQKGPHTGIGIKYSDMKKSKLAKDADSEDGAKAAKQGKPYSANPHPKGSSDHLAWSKAHNKSRARQLNMGEAKSFDQKFKDHLKFATSKSPAVQDYMKKRKDNRDAAHAKQDPSAVKKNYGPAVVPPGTAYNKARKRGMKPTDAANAVSTAFKNKAKGGKLPK